MKYSSDDHSHYNDACKALNKEQTWLGDLYVLRHHRKNELIRNFPETQDALYELEGQPKDI